MPEFGDIGSGCVRSGYCCKQAPCPFGKWDNEKHQCVHLEGEGIGLYSCGIYEEILGQPGADLCPAFGAGCCSPFNSDRRVFQLTEHGQIDSENWPR
jgi:hypothetical protein